MSFDLQLTGLRALVTGGTLGLGAAVVKALADAGVRVATSARTLPAQPVAGVTYVAADLSTAEARIISRRPCCRSGVASTSWSTCSAVRTRLAAVSPRSATRTGSPN